MRVIVHDDANTKQEQRADAQKSIESLHGHQVFRRSSPVSQDIFRASPEATLDKDCTYRSFCPIDRSDSTNPRLAVLENFKEISRIMTNNFISHKKLE